MNYYTVYLVRSGSTTYNRPANVEYKVGTVTFNGGTPAQARLADFTGGGTDQQGYFFVQNQLAVEYRDAVIPTNNFYAVPGVSTVGGISPLEGYAETTPGAPLNVSLLSFTATATAERTAKLEWQTATEKNSSHFLVERSADGLRFTDQVCRMQAAGNSNDLVTYHNEDFKPLTGNNYYRLKMVNKDGSFKYSETRRLVFEAPVADVAAIPNPFQNATTIRINADADQMANYSVMDYTGRLVRTGVWEVKKGMQNFPMPLDDAAAGNYILTVQGSTILAEIKLTKSN